MEYRDWNKDTKQYQSETPGTILTHTRKFGVEIECLGSEYEASHAMHEIPEAVGVSDDGSIRGRGYGLEFQTPIASGDKGEALIKQVCNILQRHNFKVNESTGLHVHIDMADFLPKDTASETRAKRIEYAKHALADYGEGRFNFNYEPDELWNNHCDYWQHRGTWNSETGELVPPEGEAPQYEIDAWLDAIGNDRIFDRYITTRDENYRILQNLKSVMMFYIAFDDVLLSFLPINRRGNEYCRALRSYFSLDEIAQARTHEALEEMWYRVKKEHVPNEKNHLKHGSRYRGVNFHSFFRDGHVEIRYHSGTLSASKILYWIELHNAILAFAPRCDNGYLMGMLTEIRLDKKAQTLYQVLGLSPEAIAYFTARQKKFSKVQKEVAILRNVNEPSSCVA